MTATDWVVLTEADQADRVVPIVDRLLVGRKSGGVESSQRLLLDDPAISREHLELRLDAPHGVVLVDQSTNGTRVNGRQVPRGESLVLRDGDLIEAGSAKLGFRSLEHPLRIPDAVRSTMRPLERTLIANVAGDVVGYTAMIEGEGGDDVAAAIDALFAQLRELAESQGAAVRSCGGDSLFAAWDAADDPDAVQRAVAFAVAADEIVAGHAADATGGAPIRVGWGVTMGDATAARTSPACKSVHGDAVNLAFRLAGLAARDGEPAVLVTAEVAAATPAAAHYGDPRDLAVRGRADAARVRAAQPPTT